MISKTNIFPIQILAAENFPRALKSIPNAPTQLYYRGTLPDFKHSWIAMVGTRRPSIHAEEICRALVKNLIDTDAIVVSGLAQGIDSFLKKILTSQDELIIINYINSVSNICAKTEILNVGDGLAISKKVSR